MASRLTSSFACAVLLLVLIPVAVFGKSPTIEKLSDSDYAVDSYESVPDGGRIIHRVVLSKDFKVKGWSTTHVWPDGHGNNSASFPITGGAYTIEMSWPVSLDKFENVFILEFDDGSKKKMTMSTVGDKLNSVVREYDKNGKMTGEHQENADDLAAFQQGMFRGTLKDLKLPEIPK